MKNMMQLLSILLPICLRQAKTSTAVKPVLGAAIAEGVGIAAVTGALSASPNQATGWFVETAPRTGSTTGSAGMCPKTD